MAATELVSELFDAGRRLIEALDRAGDEVTTAFWLYDPEAGDWRLYLAMPMVETRGTDHAYERVALALKGAGIENLHLRRIAVVSNRDPLVSGISKMVRLSGGSARLQRSAIGNVLIEDAVIYRST